MRVGAAGENLESAVDEPLASVRVRAAALIGAERLGRGDPQGNRLGRDHVHQRAALHAGEDRRVDRFAQCSARQRIKPPRGPRRVLWVVVVTKSA